MSISEIKNDTIYIISNHCKNNLKDTINFYLVSAENKYFKDPTDENLANVQILKKYFKNVIEGFESISFEAQLEESFVGPLSLFDFSINQ